MESGWMKAAALRAVKRYAVDVSGHKAGEEKMLGLGFTN